MTTNNDQEDFLKALRENPAWRETVRTQILGDELLQLPDRFQVHLDRMDAFIAEQKEINAELRAMNAELRESNARHAAENAEQKETNARHDTDVIDLKAMIAELRESNARHAAENAEQKELNTRHDTDVIDLKAMIAELREINARHAAENADQKEINARHAADITEQKETNARHDTDVIDLKAMIAELREINARHAAENAEQKELNARHAAENAEQKEINARHAAENAEQRETNARQDTDAIDLKAMIAELKDLNARHAAENAEQKILNARIIARLDRMENDISIVKGGHARIAVREAAEVIAMEMGLEYVKSLTQADLLRLYRNANGNLTAGERRSFQNADLVVEATDGVESVYIAAEISFTADFRDSDRVIRNSRLLTEYTGRRAIPTVASVRNDYHVTELVEDGQLYWYFIDTKSLGGD